MRPRSDQSAGSPRGLISDLPLTVLGRIAVLLLVHGARSFLSVETDLAILLRFGFIPARWTFTLDPTRLEAVLREAAHQGYAPEAAR